MASIPPNDAPASPATREAFHVGHLLEYGFCQPTISGEEHDSDTHELYISVCAQLTNERTQKIAGWICMGMLKFWKVTISFRFTREEEEVPGQLCIHRVVEPLSPTLENAEQTRLWSRT